ncbi:hypothetical protein BJF80_09530 [Serinicoccus sp. CUA-874]|uniref:hypothetical protein n=1 Tax=Serinicoccus sp. CUA-874 TaxID=1517939 RepID=UPI0009629A5D|nr:hypothetical protein [Serinicoccus sp. CUA-874]OLT15622.1 hypothetical protein BJF80_09530 [Serinicoccus sp. CUA-874]
MFTPDELANLPVVGARLVWSRDGRDLLTGAPPPSPAVLDTVDVHSTRHSPTSTSGSTASCAGSA